GREACERARAGMALPSGGPLDRAPDHGGRRERVSRGHRGQADRAAPPHGEVQGRSHQVLRGTAEFVDGPWLRGREAQTRCRGRRCGRGRWRLMPLLRTKEIRAMDAEAIAKKLSELRDELMHERGVAAMGGAPPNPGKIRALRKNIARILTIMSEEQRGASAA